MFSLSFTPINPNPSGGKIVENYTCSILFLLYDIIISIDVKISLWSLFWFGARATARKYNRIGPPYLNVI